MYHVVANAILVEPLKLRHGPEIHRAHKTLFARLTKAGCKPKLHRLDNEASGDLKRYLQDEAIDFQLVPPHMHRRNAAERAIQTFKNHFVSALAITPPIFPLKPLGLINSTGDTYLKSTATIPHQSLSFRVCTNT